MAAGDAQHDEPLDAGADHQVPETLQELHQVLEWHGDIAVHPDATGEAVDCEPSDFTPDEA